MQWAEAGFQMISVVSGKICPPRNFGGRRVFKKLDDFSCNTPNQRIGGGIPRIKDQMGRSETGFGVIPAQQFVELADGLSSMDQNRPLRRCSARLVYSTCILLAKIRVTWCPSVSKGKRSESTENSLKFHF